MAKDALAERKLLLQLVGTGSGTTRPELTSLSGLSRSTVAQRVSELVEVGLLEDVGPGVSHGGRRAGRLAFSPGAGVVVAVEVGNSYAQVRISDLGARGLYTSARPIRLSWGGRRVMAELESSVREGLEETGLAFSAVRSCGLSLATPVNHPEGTLTTPRDIPGWSDAPVASAVQAWLPVPVVVDNDVNAMALADYTYRWRHEGLHDLIYVKYGTGIGCGVIAGGRLHRGADGTAGEIAHSKVAGVAEEAQCFCGSTNCLEAVASGSALLRRLRSLGYDIEIAGDIVRLVAEGDARVINLIRNTGREIAASLIPIVDFFNPGAIVVGGSLGSVEISLLAGMREVIYGGAGMASTRRLRIVPSSLGYEAGLAGCTQLALDAAYEARLEEVFGVRGLPVELAGEER